jgi:thaumarchaeosortase
VISERLGAAFASFKSSSAHIKVLLIFLSILAPFTLLYGINAKSFDQTYNGRAYYLFFVWLVVLVFAFDWEKYRSKPSSISTKSKVAFGIALALPTCYVIASNFFGVNDVIMAMGKTFGIITPWLNDLPLSVEFMIFALLFGVVFFAAYRRKGLSDFSLTIALLAAVGIINLLTILYPYSGNNRVPFTPFQILVPSTAGLSRDFLNLMGYKTALMGSADNVPILWVSNGQTYFVSGIAWPCAGIDSLIIYSVVMLLFLRKADFPRLHKVAYFAFGAVITYLINVLRIVTIFLIGLTGDNAAVSTFHGFYGQFYSTVWIVSYILIIIGSRIMWSKLRPAKLENAVLKEENGPALGPEVKV